MKKSWSARRLALLGVLCAMALALSYLERFLPLDLLIPLPGVKLGLANVVTLFALWALGPWDALWVLVPRCLLGALFGGGSGLLYSLLGGLFSFFTMLTARRLPFLSLYGVSVLGAAAHSFGQVAAALLLLRSPALLVYLPPLLLLSVPCGLATALMATGALRGVPQSLYARPEK